MLQCKATAKEHLPPMLQRRPRTKGDRVGPGVVEVVQGAVAEAEERDEARRESEKTVKKTKKLVQDASFTTFWNYSTDSFNSVLV